MALAATLLLLVSGMVLAAPSGYCRCAPLSREPAASGSKHCQDVDAKVLEVVQRDEAAEVDLLSVETKFFLVVMSSLQCKLGLEGSLGEIGASWQAMTNAGQKADFFSFEVLSALRQPSERVLLGGPFAGESEDGFQHQLPDIVAKGNSLLQESWLHQLPWALGDLTDAELCRQSGHTGFRLLRLDRTLTSNETYKLLHSASCALREGGILIFEGLAAVSTRPGLQEGFHRFLREAELSAVPGKRLVPFLWGGKRGGLFLTSESWAPTYRQAVWDFIPHRFILNVGHDTKFMYGSQVLYTAFWEPDSKSVEEALRALRHYEHRDAGRLGNTLGAA